MKIIGENTQGTPSNQPEQNKKSGGIPEIAAKWQKKWNDKDNGGDKMSNVTEAIESMPYEGPQEATRVSQMMALVQNTTARLQDNSVKNRVLFDRSNLIPKKSIIRFTAHNGDILEYQYLRDSSAEDKEITKIPFLKLRNIQDKRVVIWNGVISPAKDVIYAILSGKGKYSLVDVPFNTVL